MAAGAEAMDRADREHGESQPPRRNIGVTAVELTTEYLCDIDDALSRISVRRDRYPAHSPNDGQCAFNWVPSLLSARRTCSLPLIAREPAFARAVEAVALIACEALLGGGRVMVTKVFGYAVHSAQDRLAPWKFERRNPRPDNVVIDILLCGVCHSDLHNVRNDWSHAIYPMVPGHEIIGRVVDIGSNVPRFKVGDIVGVGCLIDSCRHCNPRLRGLEQYCYEGSANSCGGINRNRRDRTTS